MKQKNFIVECISNGVKETFIVRELPRVPNAPAEPVAVCDSPEELAAFFGKIEY